MAKRARKIVEREDPVDVETEIDADLEPGSIAHVADTLDTVMSSMRITNEIAVGALSVLLMHAYAQMYSMSAGRPETHDQLVQEIAPFFAQLDHGVATKATAELFLVETDGLLPN